MEQNGVKNNLNSNKIPTVFSGVQPSGFLTIGNYLGAIGNWINLQNTRRAIFCVVDLHSITQRQDPVELKNATLRTLATYIACGLDPERCLLFIQSHISEHTELAWVLNCYTQFGELSRMTQFKDKSARHAENINAGLFTYPVLMAADILLYDTNEVPVGADQKQHVEIARDIGERFNGIYGDVLVLPEPTIPKVGAKIMNILEPTKKMSKSDDNPNGVIFLADDDAAIIKKFKRAVTDSEMCVKQGESKDGINNLMQIYRIATKKSYAEIEREFEGKGYGDFKAAVGQATADMLRPIRLETERLLKDTSYLESVYKKGAEGAKEIASATLKRVYDAVGFVR